MLGLQRGIVKLVSHHTEWAILFAQEKARLSAVLEDKALDIQHIGSTAVPGLEAKPILDIAVAVAELLVVKECVSMLGPLGYAYFGDREENGDYFFAKGDDQNRTHYLHMVKLSGSEWADCLSFRDYLIANLSARQRYSRLKHLLFQQYANDRQAYTAGKAALIQSLLREASAEAA